MITIFNLGEASSLEESLDELDGERRVAIVDVTYVDGILDSSFLVDQLESLNLIKSLKVLPS
jgi:hypothetical protein